MQIIVDRLPKTSHECIFRSCKGKCLIRKHQGYFSKCTLLEESKCPYLISFDEAAHWREKVGEVPNELGRCIYQVQNGNLPPLNNITDNAPKLEPEYYSDCMTSKVNPHTFTKRKFGR